MKKVAQLNFLFWDQFQDENFIVTPSNTITYTIDYISDINCKNDTNKSHLLTINPLPTPVIADVAGNKYIVQSGDYLFKIAVLHNTSVQALILANNIVNSDLVLEGQVLILPE